MNNPVKWQCSSRAAMRMALYWWIATGGCVIALAQGTRFNFQGQLSDAGSHANGTYDLRFAVFDAGSSGAQVGDAVTNVATPVTSGMFTVTLDFGSEVFTGAARWLEMAVRTNGGSAFNILSPRHSITPTPYAIFAGGVSAAEIIGILSNSQVPSNIARLDSNAVYTGAVTFDNIASVFNGTFFGNAADTAAIPSFTWGGDANTGLFRPVADTLAISTSGTERMRVSSGGDVGIGTSAPESRLHVRTPVNVDVALRLTSGGSWNLILNQSPSSVFTITNGGQARLAILPGGNVGIGTVAPGSRLTVAGDVQAERLKVGTDGVLNGEYSSITGGFANTNLSDFCFIGGGYENLIAVNNALSTIGGGSLNSILREAYYSTIGGGVGNSIATNSFYATIGGGSGNTIRPGIDSVTIAGGNWNSAGGPFGAIGGGLSNVITVNGTAAVLAGGIGNRVDDNWSSIAGGYYNSNRGAYSFISGGYRNLIGTNTGGATIGGGVVNQIRSESHESTIGGGGDNIIEFDGSGNTISGGGANVIGANVVFAAISGGRRNTNSGSYSMIAGGASNAVSGDFAFAAGRRAKANHTGTFVWADSQDADFSSTGDNQFLIRAAGGVGIGDEPDAMLHVTSVTTNSADNTAKFSAARIGPHHSHIHYGTNGDWYIRSANAAGKVILQDNGGNVGIGTSSPTARLSVNGTANNATGVWGIFSDRRLKQDIATIPAGSLDRLLQLEGVTYQYNRDDLRESYSGIHRGWIAQDVEQVFPDWVSEAPGGMKMVTPVGFNALAVEALRELRAEKDAEIAALKQKNADMETRLGALEKHLNQLSPAQGGE